SVSVVRAVPVHLHGSSGPDDPGAGRATPRYSEGGLGSRPGPTLGTVPDYSAYYRKNSFTPAIHNDAPRLIFVSGHPPDVSRHLPNIGPFGRATYPLDRHPHRF